MYLTLILFQAVMEENATNGMAEMYAATLDKYETLRKDFDALREQYAELGASRSSAISRIEALTEENSNFASQLDELRAKNELLSQERNGLKQQCTNAIREWNQASVTIVFISVPHQIYQILPQCWPLLFFP